MSNEASDAAAGGAASSAAFRAGDSNGPPAADANDFFLQVPKVTAGAFGSPAVGGTMFGSPPSHAAEMPSWGEPHGHYPQQQQQQQQHLPQHHHGASPGPLPTNENPFIPTMATTHEHETVDEVGRASHAPPPPQTHRRKHTANTPRQLS